jgi:hypothetical protein
MEAVRTSETSVDNYFTRQYIPEDNSEHHTRPRENLKSHTEKMFKILPYFNLTSILQKKTLFFTSLDFGLVKTQFYIFYSTSLLAVSVTFKYILHYVCSDIQAL